jgi:hypothetical protein
MGRSGADHFVDHWINFLWSKRPLERESDVTARMATRLNSLSLPKCSRSGGAIYTFWRRSAALGSPMMLRDDDFGAAFVEIGDDGVAVEGGVSDQAAKGEPVDQRRHADGVEPMGPAAG